MSGSDMKQIPVGNELTALVDDKDYDLVAAYRWYPFHSGQNTYAQANTGGHRNVLMHVLIAGKRRDHKDGNGLNNQRSNLRDATCSQNAANSRKRTGTQSRYKGVTYQAAGCSRDKRWKAYITKDGQRISKNFATEEEAARWRDQKAVELFGEYARLNFPRA